MGSRRNCQSIFIVANREFFEPVRQSFFPRVLHKYNSGSGSRLETRIMLWQDVITSNLCMRLGVLKHVFNICSFAVVSNCAEIQLFN